MDGGFRRHRQIGNAAELVEAAATDGGIDAELEGPFAAKLAAAPDALERGNPNSAKTTLNELKALIQQIEAQRDKKIDSDVADELIPRINEIIASITTE